MTEPSPDFAINAGSVGVKAIVAPGGAVRCIIDSDNGVTSVAWEIIRTDETTVVADWMTGWTTSGSVGQQLDFTAPADTGGVAAVIQCEINSGQDQAGDASSVTRATAKVYILDANGKEVLTNDELTSTSLESNSTHGAVEAINESIRNGGTLVLATINTTDNTTQTGALLAAPEDGDYEVEMWLIGRENPASGDHGVFWRRAAFEVSSGTVTQIGATQTPAADLLDGAAGWTATITTDAADIQYSFDGAAGDTVAWTVRYAIRRTNQ